MRTRELRHLALAAAVMLVPWAVAAQPAEDAPRDTRRDRPSKKEDVRVPDEKVRQAMREVQLQARKEAAHVRAELEVAQIELEQALSAKRIDEEKVMGIADHIGGMQAELHKIQLRSHIALTKALGPERARALSRMRAARAERRPFLGRRAGRQLRGQRGVPPALGQGLRRGQRPGAGPALQPRGRSARPGRPEMGRASGRFGQAPFMAERFQQRLGRRPLAREWLEAQRRGRAGLDPGSGQPWMGGPPWAQPGMPPGPPAPGFGAWGPEAQPPMPPAVSEPQPREQRRDAPAVRPEERPPRPDRPAVREPERPSRPKPKAERPPARRRPEQPKEKEQPPQQ